VPLIVTLVPTGPFAGVKLAIVGAAMKLVALVAVPPGVVTRSGPVVTPAGAVACITVSEVTVKVAALTPLNVTAVAPVKLVPLIVTTVPAGPLAGVKLAIVDATAKVLALVAVPPAVVTRSGPVVAPLGTVACITVSEVTVKVAALTP
jgi:DNA-binding transcriptional regulator YdaS (Cro superfamily)